MTREGITITKGGNNGVKTGVVKSALNSVRTGAFQIRPNNVHDHDVLNEDVIEPEVTTKEVQQQLADLKAVVVTQQDFDDKLDKINYDVTQLTHKTTLNSEASVKASVKESAKTPASIVKQSVKKPIKT